MSIRTTVLAAAIAGASVLGVAGISHAASMPAHAGTHVHTAKTAAQRQAEAKSKLDAAVANGKLTQAQENAIIAELPQVESFRQSLKGMTAAQRKAAIASEAATLKQWASANGIPQKYIAMGERRVMGHRAKPEATSSPKAN